MKSDSVLLFCWLLLFDCNTITKFDTYSESRLACWYNRQDLLTQGMLVLNINHNLWILQNGGSRLACRTR